MSEALMFYRTKSDIATALSESRLETSVPRRQA
jgi:hypothetical protein